MLTIRILNNEIYTKIIKSLLLGQGDAGRSGFYSASYFGYDGLLLMEYDLKLFLMM